MDHRIPLVASCLVGTTLGIGVMAASAPNTGPTDLHGVVAATPLAPPRPAPDAAAARPRPPASRPAVPAPSRATVQAVQEEEDGGWGSPEVNDPFAAMGDGNPFGAAVNPEDDPFAGWGEPSDNPFAAEAANNPFAAAANNPFAAAADNPFAAAAQDDPFAALMDNRPDAEAQRKSAPAGLLGGSSNLPGDVRGVGKLFRDRDGIVQACMTRDAPAVEPNERRVMIRVQLSPRPDNPSVAGVASIEAPRDPEGRYAAFLTCLQQGVADAIFDLPASSSTSVNWSLRR